jgi:hypothetical protein
MDSWYQTSTVVGNDAVRDRMMIQGLYGIGQIYRNLSVDPAPVPILTRCVRAGAGR